MPAPKFNFIPERQITELEEKHNGYWLITFAKAEATIKGRTYNKYTLYFPQDMVHALELEGKYLRFFVDKEKKLIGWRIVTEEGDLSSIRDLRVCKVNKGGGALFSVKEIVDYIGYKYDNGSAKLRVENATSTYTGDVSYVTLPTNLTPQRGKGKTQIAGQVEERPVGSLR